MMQVSRFWPAFVILFGVTLLIPYRPRPRMFGGGRLPLGSEYVNRFAGWQSLLVIHVTDSALAAGAGVIVASLWQGRKTTPALTVRGAFLVTGLYAVCFAMLRMVASVETALVITLCAVIVTCLAFLTGLIERALVDRCADPEQADSDD